MARQPDLMPHKADAFWASAEVGGVYSYSFSSLTWDEVLGDAIKHGFDVEYRNGTSFEIMGTREPLPDDVTVGYRVVGLHPTRYKGLLWWGCEQAVLSAWADDPTEAIDLVLREAGLLERCPACGQPFGEARTETWKGRIVHLECPGQDWTTLQGHPYLAHVFWNEAVPGGYYGYDPGLTWDEVEQQAADYGWTISRFDESGDPLGVHSMYVVGRRTE